MSRSRKNQGKRQETAAAAAKAPATSAWGNAKMLLPIFVLTLVVYLPSFNNEFLNYDDNWFITENPQVLGFPETLPRIFSDFYHGQYAPLPTLAFAVHFAAVGEDPRLFHVSSLLVHLANVALVFFLVNRLFARRALGGLVALLFAIHPMNVETVAWLSASMKVGLYTMFFLLAVISYLNYVQRPAVHRYFAVIGFFVLSFLCKEQAVFLSVLLVACDLLLGRKWNDKKVILEKVPFFALSLIFGIIAILASKSNKEVFALVESSLLDRIAWGSYAVCAYVWKLILPLGLSAYYPYPQMERLPVYMAMFPILLILLVASLAFAVRRNHRPAAFAIAFFLINIAFTAVFQVLSVRPTMMADRYVYLAGIGVLLLAGTWFFMLMDARKRFAPLLVILLGAYVAWLSASAYGRNLVWQNSLTMWEDVSKSFPESAEALNNQGNYYYERKEYDRALELFDESIRLEPTGHRPLMNKALIYMAQGKNAQALEILNRVLELDDRNVLASYNRGNVLLGMKKPREAIDDYTRAIRSRADYHQAYVNRGNAFRDLKEYENALADYNRAAELFPRFPKMYSNRGLLFLNQGKYEQALSDFDKALEIDPRYYKAYANRAAVYIQKEEYEPAIRELTDSLRANPNFAHSYYWRGVCQHRSGRPAAAVRDFDQAIRLKPRAGTYYLQRSYAQRDAGAVERARQDARAAQELGAAVDASYIESLERARKRP